MPKADVLALVDFLGGGADDPITVDKYYGDTMIQLAREDWTTDAQVFQIVANQTDVDLSPFNYVNLLGMVYDDMELDELPLRQLEMLDPYWRDAMGRPTSFTEQDESAKMIGIYPAPDTTATPLGGTYGEPLGGDYTPNNAILFFSVSAGNTPPYWLELPAALHILWQEFNRVSDHPDPQMCETAKGLEQLFKEMLK